MDVSHVRTVVGALAHRVDMFSCPVFMCDCGDMQILQSSDLSLLAFGELGVQC